MNSEATETTAQVDALVLPVVPPDVATYAKRGACCVCRWHYYGNCHFNPPDSGGFATVKDHDWCRMFEWNGDPPIKCATVNEIPDLSVTACNIIAPLTWSVAGLLKLGRHKVQSLDGIGVKTMAVLDAALMQCKEWYK